MPARITKIRHDENTRMKIKVSHIINRFQQHFDGLLELTSTQIKAGEILLDRALPRLQSVEVSGDISISRVLRAPEVIETIRDWNETYVPIEHRTEQ
jgi:hypothetical protein